jgi:hypothetical protein
VADLLRHRFAVAREKLVASQYRGRDVASFTQSIPSMYAFQIQVFLESLRLSKTGLRNQLVVRAVPGGVLEGCGFDGGCCPFCSGDYFLFARASTAISGER